MKTQRQRDLAKIHIAKKQLGMSESDYRDMLKAVAGVSSSAKLDRSGRHKVLQHLRKSGFKARQATRFPGKPDFKQLAGTGKLAMMRKIEAYLAEAKRPWKYAHSMAKRMSFEKVDRIEWCSPDDLRAIIVALEADAVKHGRYTGR